MKIKLDSINRKILEILQKNSNITNEQLAHEVNLSPASTLERVKKLENQQIIKSYHAQIDLENVGLGVNTFVTVSLKGHNKQYIEKFIAAIKNIPEVIECHHVIGQYDFIIRIVSTDIRSYQTLMVEKLSNIEVVDNLQSIIILSSLEENKTIPLP